jgi:hypothetical protein
MVTSAEKEIIANVEIVWLRHEREESEKAHYAKLDAIAEAPIPEKDRLKSKEYKPAEVTKLATLVGLSRALLNLMVPKQSQPTSRAKSRNLGFTGPGPVTRPPRINTGKAFKPANELMEMSRDFQNKNPPWMR